MITIRLILLVLALICFGAAAANVPTRGIQLLPLGLALWVLSLIVV